MQVEHEGVQKVIPGDEVGIKTKEKVHENDTVYLVTQ